MASLNSKNRLSALFDSRKKIIALLVLAILLLLAIFLYPTLYAYSHTGASYSARVVCSCRYIGGRDLEDCEKDLEPGMGMVRLSDSPDQKRINASVFLMTSQSASYYPGFGCVLDDEQNPESLRP